MNIANKFTLLRVILIPVFMVLLYIDAPYLNYVALAVFIVASLTDYLDGHLARSRNLVTNFGKFMDPLADKLLVTAAMLIFVEKGLMPAWALMIVIAREFAVSGLRMVAASDGTVIAAAMSGKIKTAATMVCLCVMMTPVGTFALGPVTLNMVCVGVIVLTTVISGVEYFVKNGHVLTQEL